MTEIAVMPRVEVVQRQLEAFNGGDWETYAARLTPHVTHIEPGGVELRGRDAVVEGIKRYRVAFPDLTGKIVRLIPGDAGVAAEIVWTGTHNGPLGLPTGTIPATGKPILVHASLVWVFEGDLIDYTRHYWDLTELLGAIGALPGAS